MPIQTKKIFKRLLVWRAKHISQTRFLYLLSILVGFTSGVGAVILKNLTHFFQQMLEKVRKVFEDDGTHSRGEAHQNAEQVQETGLGNMLCPPDQQTFKNLFCLNGHSFSSSRIAKGH